MLKVFWKVELELRRIVADVDDYNACLDPSTTERHSIRSLSCGSLSESQAEAAFVAADASITAIQGGPTRPTFEPATTANIARREQLIAQYAASRRRTAIPEQRLAEILLVLRLYGIDYALDCIDREPEAA